MALARFAGSPLLKMPLPTKTPSQPSCIMSAASAGVAMPPAEKFTTGSLPFSATHFTSSYGAWSSLAAAKSCSSGASPRGSAISAVTVRMWRTASTMLPVPASPLVRIIAAPSLMRRRASPRLRQPHTNGHREVVLVDVMLLVGGGEDLGLVDVVDAERLQDLRLDEVADAALGHDRDGDRGHDLLDHRRVGHARDAAGGADVGGHALERHDRHGAGVLGDLGLLGVTTSMMTPPLSISARPVLTRSVPVSLISHVQTPSGAQADSKAPVIGQVQAQDCTCGLACATTADLERKRT